MLTAVEGAFRTSRCEEKNKVNFASNFLRESAKIWWEGKNYEKGEEWLGLCSWKEFKDLFNAEYASAEEIDKTREEFQSLMQTNKSVNELWKKFNDMVPCCPEHHGNEKLKVKRFQRMLCDEIREVFSPFKCITLEDLLSRARVREADLQRRKRHKSNECPNFKAIEAKPLRSIKEEKVEVPNPKARVYVMYVGEDKLVPDVVSCTILVNSLPARVLYDSRASVSFVSYEFIKNLSTPPNKLPLPLEVEIADSKVVVVSNMYRDVVIEIDDSTFRIDLIPIML
ncbi:putative reverse transcriptase domain-containing protein [Tanacetum coccineum]